MSRRKPSTGPAPIQVIRDAYLRWCALGCPETHHQLELFPDDATLRVEAHRAPAARRFVVLLVMTYANGDGTNAYPSRRTVARQAGVSESTVKRAMAWALRLGWAARGTRGNQHGPTNYGFTVPAALLPLLDPDLLGPPVAGPLPEHGPPVAPADGELGPRGGSARATGAGSSGHGAPREPVEPEEPVFPRAYQPDVPPRSARATKTEDQQQGEDPTGEPVFTDDVAAYLTDRFTATDPRAYWRRLSPVDRWRVASEVDGWKADRDRAERQAAEVAARRCPHGVINGARLAADGSSVGGCGSCEREAVAS